MGLLVKLEKGEQLFVGECSVACETDKVKLHIRVNGDVPLLRERDMITAKEADTPAKRLGLALQQIYLSRKGLELHELYLLFAADVMRTSPAAASYLATIHKFVSAGDYFRAIKECLRLIEAEQAAAA